MKTTPPKKLTLPRESGKKGIARQSEVPRKSDTKRVDKNRTMRDVSTAVLLAISLVNTDNIHPSPVPPSYPESTILYVSESGSDFNSGTVNAPFLTITRADSMARPGDQIQVEPGTYRLYAPLANSIGLSTVANGTASARIKFISSIKGKAKLVITGKGTAWRSKGDYVDIEGFDISGSGRHGILASGKELTITHNFVHDLTISGGCSGAGGAAIDTDGPVGNVIIANNVIRNIGTSMVGRCNTVQGIYVANSNNFVKNNIVSGVAAVGIHQWHGATASTILNNTVFQCKVGILIGQGDSGRSEKGSSDNLVANNIVYDNFTYGIVEGGAVGGNNRYINNLTYQNETNMLVSGYVIGTISANPEFIHYKRNGLGDYRVRNTSPAFGIGAILKIPKLGAD